MTRRSRERRAAAGEGGQSAARPAAGPPHYDAYEERRLAEEVLYLHSLWRNGPPAPASAPAPPAGGSRPTRARPNQRKRRRIERPAAEPEGPGADWPLAPSPPASPSPASWPDAAPSSPAPRPQPQPSRASLAQRDALRAAEEFFSGRGSEDEDGDDEDDGSEPEDGGDAAAGFFLGLFERDAALRGYYERSHEEGEFRCMGCVGRKRKRKGRSQARRFRDCISLVHHARDAKHCGRPLAHRALAAVVCRVLGWDVKRLPSIVIDPRGTLGQALLAREGASAAVQEAKDNVDAGENGHKDAAKEDVGLEKNVSLTDDKKEDVDSAMNEGPLSDGDAAKEDVDSLMNEGPLSDGDAAKEDVDSIMNDGPLSDGDVAKEDVDKGKIGAPSNINDGEVHDQGNGTGTVEKEYDVVKAPAPTPPRGSRASTDRRKRRKIKCPDSPLAPSLPAPVSPSSRPDATLSSPAPRQQGREPSPSLLAQQDALHAAEAFFSRRGMSGEEDDDVNEAAGFFLGLFERDATLRGYYERSHKEGEFLCMGCVGMSVKRGGSRRFRDCASLVRHARAATRCGRLQAHRALAGVVCRVLGWNIKRLPSIVMDPRGTLGQALLVREGESTAQEAKGNVNIVDNDDMDAVKEDTNDIHPLSSKDTNDMDLLNSKGTNDMDLLNSKDTPKEPCKAVQEEGAIGNKQEHAKSADDMGDTCNVRLENNSSKEEAVTENKEEHTDGVVDSGDDTELKVEIVLCTHEPKKLILVSIHLWRRRADHLLFCFVNSAGALLDFTFV
ncbi:hypothetical protein D1007_16419 [Hordeum vulgare]|nr:hypothetical protein D1007_16419 [Hordeum vulgare]